MLNAVYKINLDTVPLRPLEDILVLTARANGLEKLRYNAQSYSVLAYFSDCGYAEEFSHTLSGYNVHVSPSNNKRVIIRPIYVSL